MTLYNIILNAKEQSYKRNSSNNIRERFKSKKTINNNIREQFESKRTIKYGSF
jgi:hypothetical protein